jgi:pimeloyl-ACP methyl ester carboxylesterase
MLLEHGESVSFEPVADDSWGPRRLRALLGKGLGSAFDAAAIRAIALMMDRSPLGDFEISRARVEALVEVYGSEALLREPERFFRPPSLPDVRETWVPGPLLPTVELRYRSAYQPFLPEYAAELGRYPDNLTVHARWYRSPSPRSTLVCIHGFGGGVFRLEEEVFGLMRWLRAGMDVVLLQLPFHGRRRPRNVALASALFPSPHVVRTNETFGQAVHDVHALMGWLSARGAAPAGLFGHSLGGYTAALLGSLSPAPAFVAALSPASCLTDVMWLHGQHSGLHSRAAEAGITRELMQAVFRVHSPLARPLRVPRERRFLIAGKADLLLPIHHTRALWEHWERPALHWFDGGHVAQLGRTEAFAALKDWLAEHGLARS